MTNLSSLLRQVCAALVVFVSTHAAQAQTVRYIHADGLGSVVAVTDASRNVIERRDYEPYGATVAGGREGPAFTGHVRDAATGLTYMQQRYYDAAIGRFLSLDPAPVDPATGGNFNRYKYGNNNPYRFVDPDGRQERAAEMHSDAVRSNPSAYTGFGPYAAAATGLMATPLLAEMAWLALANPATANSLAIVGAEAVAGVSLTSGPGRQVFRNLAPEDTIYVARLFSAGSVQQASYSGRLTYVVTEAGELVMGRTPHTSLSKGLPVQAAGEATFVKGELRSINNASGHYRPSGEAAKDAAEGAFQRAGFSANGKYKEERY